MTAPQEKPRYFYRDPLEAAWMFKHFGMRFEGNPGIPLQALTGQTFDSENGWSRLYLDASSQQLLEPQVGDVVAATAEWRAGHSPYEQFLQIGERYKVTLAPHITRIIQRDGKAFHWPEQEAA